MIDDAFIIALFRHNVQVFFTVFEPFLFIYIYIYLAKLCISWMKIIGRSRLFSLILVNSELKPVKLDVE